MKNRGPILVFDCGDGRTEVEGTTEDRIRDDGNLSFFVKVNDVHCDWTVVNISSKFVWSHSPPFNQMGNSRSCGPATQTHCLMAKIENTNIPT